MLSGIFYVKLETPLERAEEVNQYLGIMDFDNIKSIILVTLVKFLGYYMDNKQNTMRLSKYLC
jgi:hypothetical protein